MVLGKRQCRGVLLIWIIVGQGPTALAVGAGWGGLDIFTFIYPFSPLSPSLWETARYRLKYCLKGSLNPKQPTDLTYSSFSTLFDISAARAFTELFNKRLEVSAIFYDDQRYVDI